MSLSVPTNYVFASIPPEQRTRLQPQTVSLLPGQLLYETGEDRHYVYFPISCLLSIHVTLNNGWSIEWANVGHEGMVGLPVTLGERAAPWSVRVGIPGEAQRVRAEKIRALQDQSREFRLVTERLALYLLGTAGQSVACNRAHSILERLATWLLGADLRLRGAEFAITHTMLSEILGAARPGVSQEMQQLAQAGAVQTRRSHVRVVDRAALEPFACECYPLLRERLGWLMSGGAS